MTTFTVGGLQTALTFFVPSAIQLSLPAPPHFHLNHTLLYTDIRTDTQRQSYFDLIPVCRAASKKAAVAVAVSNPASGIF